MSDKKIRKPIPRKPVPPSENTLFIERLFEKMEQKSVLEPEGLPDWKYVQSENRSSKKRAATHDSRPDSRPDTGDSQQSSLRRSNAVRRKRAATSADIEEPPRPAKKARNYKSARDTEDTKDATEDVPMPKWIEDGPMGKARAPWATPKDFIPRRVTEQDLTSLSPLDRLVQDPQSAFRRRAATDADPLRESWFPGDDGVFPPAPRPTLKSVPSSRPILMTRSTHAVRPPHSAMPGYSRPAGDRSYTAPSSPMQHRRPVPRQDYARRPVNTPAQRNPAARRPTEPVPMSRKLDEFLAASRARAMANSRYQKRENLDDY
ncbi:hypothetical protein F4820DRAFT_453377 [Hypoxylon rubiginosum]|uniref:Uncharacterized protein n=1 Tax=Hypoxylon rubiginosum TaxID=110542 RepID=A0ACB9YKP2_9PEZI|nr:hypothetical protein F4820DRAFT_453377 [Hypoxylon rubiginosum]